MSPPKLDWFEKSVIGAVLTAFLVMFTLPSDHVSVVLGLLAVIILLVCWKIGLSIK